MSYEIRIENFEGPLDLLLHLIRKNEMDIYNIPIADITAQYLSIIDTMKSLNLDVAGEFLVMAATLLYIKSKMLLPQAEEEEGEEEEEDPRAELVRRLLEYQKYKEAAVDLNTLPQLERDVFTRKAPRPEEGGEEEFAGVGLFELVEAFRGLLKELPPETYHEVVAERLSVATRINEILSILADGKTIIFKELFRSRPARQEIVVTFLAMLEMVKLKLVRFMQSTPGGAIWLYPAVDECESGGVDVEEDALGYS